MKMKRKTIRGRKRDRFRESDLFYDPLLSFFSSSYNGKPLPELVMGKYLVHIAFRYGLNMLFSLGIIWALFKEIEIVRLTSWLFLIVFVALVVPLFFLLKDVQAASFLPLFYVRRFLIQPLLLFLLIPAFYYYLKIHNNS